MASWANTTSTFTRLHDLFQQNPFLTSNQPVRQTGLSVPTVNAALDDIEKMGIIDEINAAAVNRAYMAGTRVTHSGQPLWATAEIAATRCLYPGYGARLLALPRRTWEAIAKKAWRCGFAKPLRIWGRAGFGLMETLYLGSVAREDAGRRPVVLFARKSCFIVPSEKLNDPRARSGSRGGSSRVRRQGRPSG